MAESPMKMSGSRQRISVSTPYTLPSNGVITINGHTENGNLAYIYGKLNSAIRGTWVGNANLATVTATFMGNKGEELTVQKSDNVTIQQVSFMPIY